MQRSSFSLRQMSAMVFLSAYRRLLPVPHIRGEARF